MFAQVSGLGCISLGDRRSRVQISAARQTRTCFEQMFRSSGGRTSGGGAYLTEAKLRGARATLGRSPVSADTTAWLEGFDRETVGVIFE